MGNTGRWERGGAAMVLVGILWLVVFLVVAMSPVTVGFETDGMFVAGALASVGVIFMALGPNQ